MNETRQEKAQRLVDEGRVNIIHILRYQTEASVREDQRRYSTIIFDSGIFWCTCEWGVDHRYTDDLCAHALAVKLAVERNEETC